MITCLSGCTLVNKIIEEDQAVQIHATNTTIILGYEKRF